MKQIWAPWRAEYIQAEKNSVCIFCAAPEKKTEEGLVLYRGNTSVVMLNKYPYNGGHILIAPLRHVARLEELNDDEGADMFRLMRHSTSSLTKAFNAGGFNIGLNLGRLPAPALRITFTCMWCPDGTEMLISCRYSAM